MKPWQMSFSILILTALMLFSAVFSEGYVGIFVFSLIINGIMAVSYDIPGRSLGLISLGHAVFFGLGAYCFGIAISKGLSFFPALILSVILSFVGALMVTLLMAGLKHGYYSLATLGMLIIFQRLFETLDSLTGGSAGLYIPVTISKLHCNLTGRISACGNRSMSYVIFPIPLGTLFQRNGSQRGSGRSHRHSNTNSEDPVLDDCRHPRLHGRCASPGPELLRKSGLRIQSDTQHYSLAGFASCAGKGHVGSAAWCPAHYCSRRSHLDKI